MVRQFGAQAHQAFLMIRSWPEPDLREMHSLLEATSLSAAYKARGGNKVLRQAVDTGCWKLNMRIYVQNQKSSPKEKWYLLTLSSWIRD